MKHIFAAITLMSIVACNSSEGSRSTSNDPEAFKKGKATLSIAGKDVDEVVYFGIGTNDTGVTCLEHKSIQHSEIQIFTLRKGSDPSIFDNYLTRLLVSFRNSELPTGTLQVSSSTSGASIEYFVRGTGDKTRSERYFPSEPCNLELSKSGSKVILNMTCPKLADLGGEFPIKTVSIRGKIECSIHEMK